MANSSLGIIVYGSLQGKEKLEDTIGAFRDRNSKDERGNQRL